MPESLIIEDFIGSKALDNRRSRSGDCCCCMDVLWLAKAGVDVVVVVVVVVFMVFVVVSVDELGVLLAVCDDELAVGMQTKW